MREDLSRRLSTFNRERTCLQGTEVFSYGELLDMTQRLKESIYDKGEAHLRIGLLAKSDEAYALFALALMESGTYVPLDPSLNEAKWMEIMTQAKVDVCLVEKGMELGLSIPMLVFTLKPLSITGNHVSSKYKHDTQVGILGFTSGTSAVPKRVPLDYASWVYSIDRYNRFFDFDENVVQLVVVHSFKIASLYIILRTWLAGGRVVLSPVRDYSSIFKWLESGEITHLNGPPALLESLLNSFIRTHRQTPKSPLIIHTSGALLTGSLHERLSEGFNAQVYNNYGLTEVYYIASTYKTSVKAPDSGQMIIDDYRIVEGELQVKGPQVFRAYDGDDGGFDGEWFKTGDLVEIKDGMLKIIGRSKEMINRGGEKVSPYEVEDMIYKLFPYIKTCLVFPIPQTSGFEAVGCAIVSEHDVDLIDLRTVLLGHISAMKCPTKLYRFSALPTMNDKFRRSLLYDEFILKQEKSR